MTGRRRRSLMPENPQMGVKNEKDFKTIVEQLTSVLKSAGVALDAIATALKDHLGLSVIATLCGLALVIYWNINSREITDLQNRLEIERAHGLEVEQRTDKLVRDLLPS